MSLVETNESDSYTQPVEKIPVSVFDHGVGAEFEAVHIHSIDTPDGVFITDGCILVHEDWCDDAARQRVRYTATRPVDAEWWRQSFHTRTTNHVDGFPLVTIRPWYQMCLEQMGADLKWRSYDAEALTVLDTSRQLRAVVAGWLSPYKPTVLAEHRPAITHLLTLYRRHAPSLHPHQAALAALIAVDERSGAPAQQMELEVPA